MIITEMSEDITEINVIITVMSEDITEINVIITVMNEDITEINVIITIISESIRRGMCKSMSIGIQLYQCNLIKMKQCY